MIVCFLGYLLAVSVFFTTFAHKIYVVLKMEKVYAHRESGVETNIIGCATYELKKGQFKPSYLGQLAAYLRILDDDEKLSFENPSVGIILCKKADKAYVDYVLQDYLKPMGVATYKHMQDRLKELLPPEEEMKRLMTESKGDE